MLRKDPDHRIGSIKGIEEIKSHAFFRDINWKNVKNKKYKYEKQDLKIDLLNTNFASDENMNININIDEECEEDQGYLNIENENVGDIEMKKRSSSFTERSLGFDNIDRILQIGF